MTQTKHLQLTKNEQLVFSYALTRADLLIPELSKQCKLKIHTVRRALQSLIDKGVFHRKSALLNYSTLGLTLYRIAFSLSGVTLTERQAFTKLLCSSVGVRTVLELGGTYQYDVEFVAFTRQRLSSFLDSLSKCCGPNLQIVDMAIIESENLYGHKYLLPDGLGIKPLGYDPSMQIVKLDDVDHRILRSLSAEGLASIQHLSRLVGLPATTCRYRLDRLEGDGVIAGYFYVFDVKPIEIMPFVLYVYSNGMTAELKQRMQTFCEKHPQVVYLISAIGKWSFAVYIDVPTFDDALRVSHELQGTFRREVSKIDVLPLMRFNHFSAYPIA